MKNYSILIKPASSRCNLKCDYCFYLNTAENRKVHTLPLLSLDTVKVLMEKIFVDADTVHFMFQGGEPTLVNLSWYKSFIELSKKMNTKNIPVSLSFQTNGTMINDDWAKFFSENKILVGLSLDGFPQLNNLHRKTTNGEKTSNHVMNGIKALKKAKVPFNILSVVTNDTVNNLDQSWRFFMKNGLFYLQYIPAIDPINEEKNKYLSPSEYGKFLITLYDRWEYHLKNNAPVSIRLFDNLISMMMGKKPEACDMCGICSVQYVIEGNGDIYPCDFYCLDDYKLGNIIENSIEEIDKKRDEIKFIEKSKAVNEDCKNCPYFYLCRNGGKKYRDNNGKFRFCESYKMLFDNRLEQMAEIVKLFLDSQKEDEKN